MKGFTSDESCSEESSSESELASQPVQVLSDDNDSYSGSDSADSADFANAQTVTERPAPVAKSASGACRTADLSNGFGQGIVQRASCVMNGGTDSNTSSSDSDSSSSSCSRRTSEVSHTVHNCTSLPPKSGKDERPDLTSSPEAQEVFQAQCTAPDPPIAHDEVLGNSQFSKQADQQLLMPPTKEVAVADHSVVRDAMKESALWAALGSMEAAQLRSALAALAQYRELMEENERATGALHARLAAGKRKQRSARQRALCARQETALTRRLEVDAAEELERWRRRRAAAEAAEAEAVPGLRAQRAALQAELLRFREEVSPVRRELRGLRDRLEMCEASGRAQSVRLSTLKTECQRATAAVRVEQTEELAAFRVRQAEEVSSLDADWQRQLSELRVTHSEALSELRCSLEEASRRRERLRHDRDDAAEELLRRNREGAQLQQRCAESRQDLANIMAQGKAPQSPSQSGLGFSSLLDASATAASLGDELHADPQLQSMRQRCKNIERVCSKTHNALERRHSECERWRRRVFEPISRLQGGKRLEPFTLGPAEESDVRSQTGF